MPTIELTVRLTVRAPVLTRATAPGAFGLDQVAAREAGGRSRPILPGTLVAGRIAHAWRDLDHLTGRALGIKAADWLGEGSLEITEGDRVQGGVGDADPGVRYAPRPKRLMVHDFVALTPEDTEAGAADRLARIRIDPDTGAVETGALLMAELPFLPGREVVFEGKITALTAKEDEAATVRTALTRAFNWMGQVGGGRSIGYGRILSVEVGEAKPSARAPATRPEPEGTRLAFALIVHDPFCIAGARNDSQTFESLTHIPGGALKGAIAGQWAATLGLKPGGRRGQVRAGDDPARPDLSRHFAALRFTHAFPAPAGSRVRPVRAPLSLGFVDGTLRDFIGVAGSALDIATAPAFEPDWKSKQEDAVRAQFGWPAVNTELRIRTAISREFRRAEDEKLFAYEMVIPEGLVWIGAVDLAQVPEAARPAVLDQLHDLVSSGITGLGKTKARAGLEWLDGSGAQKLSHSLEPRKDGGWAVTLQTPALMLDASDFDEMADAARLEAAYRAYFDEASDGLLTLADYFARQELGGSDYIYRRYQQRPGAVAPYRPFLLTRAGAVFLVKPTGDAGAAKDRLARWMAEGLPLTPAIRAAYDLGDAPMEAWQYCPYVPESGYGEIAVNLDHGCAPWPGAAA